MNDKNLYEKINDSIMFKSDRVELPLEVWKEVATELSFLKDKVAAVSKEDEFSPSIIGKVVSIIRIYVSKASIGITGL